MVPVLEPHLTAIELGGQDKLGRMADGLNTYLNTPGFHIELQRESGTQLAIRLRGLGKNCLQDSGLVLGGSLTVLDFVRDVREEIAKLCGGGIHAWRKKSCGQARSRVVTRRGTPLNRR